MQLLIPHRSFVLLAIVMVLTAASAAMAQVERVADPNWTPPPYG